MIPEFALRLICGLSTVWCLAPRREITSGFFRIQMLIGLGLSVLAVLTANQTDSNGFNSPLRWIAGILGGLSFLGSVMWTLERRKAGTVFAVLILLLSTTAVIGLSVPDVSTEPLSGHTAIIIRSGGEALSSAWLIGATTAAMLLGHWYLTATGMKLTPFIFYNTLVGGAAVVRTVFAIWMMAGQSDLQQHVLLVILRCAGLIGPLVLSVLTVQILKYRNTQSATGVLYAATILVFMGEMAAVLLASEGESFARV